MTTKEPRAGMHTVHTLDPIGAGERVRAARARRGWTQSQLAAHSGLSRNSVGAVEDGRGTPRTVGPALRALDLETDGSDDTVTTALRSATNEQLMAEVLNRMSRGNR